MAFPTDPPICPAPPRQTSPRRQLALHPQPSTCGSPRAHMMCTRQRAHAHLQVLLMDSARARAYRQATRPPSACALRAGRTQDYTSPCNNNPASAHLQSWSSMSSRWRCSACHRTVLLSRSQAVRNQLDPTVGDRCRGRTLDIGYSESRRRPSLSRCARHDRPDNGSTPLWASCAD
jgi:hypothetical protein